METETQKKLILEYSKIILKGGDITPEDRNRLQEIETETGMTLEEIEKAIAGILLD